MKIDKNIVDVLKNIPSSYRLSGLIVIALVLLSGVFLSAYDKLSQEQLYLVLCFTLLILLIFGIFAFYIMNKAVPFDTNKNTKPQSQTDEWGKAIIDQVHYPASLIVIEDVASIQYSKELDCYNLNFVKIIENKSNTPIIRFFFRIAVDLFPNNLELAKKYYRDNPLEMDKLNFKAHDPNGSELCYEINKDMPNCKDIYLILNGPLNSGPLYPTETRKITYSYRVSTQHWGTWFQRNIRLLTKMCEVNLIFKRDLNVLVWGKEMPLHSGEKPISPKIDSKIIDENIVFTWKCLSPTQDSRYRFMWNLP